MNNMLESDEQIIWEGSPNKKSYFFQKFAMIIPILIFISIFIGLFLFMSGGMNNGFGFKTIENIQTEYNNKLADLQIEYDIKMSNAKDESDKRSAQSTYDFRKQNAQIRYEQDKAELERPNTDSSENEFSSKFDMFRTIQSIFIFIPLIIILSAIIVPILEYKNIRYAITNKRIMIQKGIIGRSYRAVEYTKVDDINVLIGLFNKIFNTGTIVFTGDFGQIQTKQGVVNTNLSFEAVDNPYDVFNKVKEVSRDIRTDVYYPNDLRPDENNGYNTEYKKEE